MRTCVVKGHKDSTFSTLHCFARHDLATAPPEKSRSCCVEQSNRHFVSSTGLHQAAGASKICVAQCCVNHSWPIALQVTARGLGTRLIWHDASASRPRVRAVQGALHRQVRSRSLLLGQRRSVLEFLQSAYEAAADLGRWERAALERSYPRRQPDKGVDNVGISGISLRGSSTSCGGEVLSKGAVGLLDPVKL
jgi:hypothetical protein